MQKYSYSLDNANPLVSLSNYKVFIDCNYFQSNLYDPIANLYLSNTHSYLPLYLIKFQLKYPFNLCIIENLSLCYTLKKLSAYFNLHHHYP